MFAFTVPSGLYRRSSRVVAQSKLRAHRYIFRGDECQIWLVHLVDDDYLFAVSG